MPTQEADTVLETIQKRVSARIPFDPGRNIPKEDMQRIAEAARWAPTAHNMQNFELIIVDDKELLESIGNINMPISKAFIRENIPLLSFSEEEWRQRKVGILGNFFPKSWLNPDAWEGDGVVQEKEEETSRSRFQGDLIANCSALVVILYDPTHRAPASEGDFLGIMSLGCMLENIWLEANALGINFHIVSSLAVDPAATEIKKILNVPDPWTVSLTIRLGYTEELFDYMRVRRDIEDFVHHNQYDNKGLD